MVWNGINLHVRASVGVFDMCSSRTLRLANRANSFAISSSIDIDQHGQRPMTCWLHY